MSEIIIALDFNNQKVALEFLKQFKNPIYVKVGMELYYACGPSIINEIKNLGHKIFLDLKLHDIPNTVANTVNVLALMDVDMINIHCAGGLEMMSQAMKKLNELKKRPLCIGVTQLTSTNQKILNQEILIDLNLNDVVIEYAKNAKVAGLDGVVCSPHEANLIHQHCGEKFLTVTPGIRLLGDQANDQKRIMTPIKAKANGCDFMVIGRSITLAANPYEVYQKIAKEIM